MNCRCLTLSDKLNAHWIALNPVSELSVVISPFRQFLQRTMQLKMLLQLLVFRFFQKNCLFFRYGTGSQISVYVKRMPDTKQSDKKNFYGARMKWDVHCDAKIIIKNVLKQKISESNKTACVNGQKPCS
jgi:hypothetical protein